MNKISNTDFLRECQLLQGTRKERFKIRMGQFFCNKFPWLVEVEPTLFYMTDDRAAANIIKKYVE